jgi:hypothetical protein
MAVAQLLSGNYNLTIAQIPQVLGAPIAQLIANKSSILYGGRSLKDVARTKASGAPSDKGDKVVTTAPVYIPPAPTKGAPVVKPIAGPSKADPNGELATLAWALAQLAAGGVNCAAWTALGEPGRINTTRNFFYGIQVAQIGAHTRPRLPVLAEDLRDAINVACDLPIGPRDAVISPVGTQGVPRDVSAQWWARVRATGVTCDQWYTAQEWQRYQMIQSLTARGIIDRGRWADWQVLQAIDGECQRSVEPAASDPAAPIRARLRAILDCANLDAQDKMQQIAVIQRAFPELGRDRRSLYRLALARYDACHPATEPGWSGRGSPMVYDPAQFIRNYVQSGGNDILDGDTAGVSWAQWVKQGPYMESGAPDLFDPVQGATGDCYFIAAMASVAWTRPDAIVRNGQPVTPDRRRFTFGGASVDVSERTPCKIFSGFMPVFARGSRLNDQWPGVMEKAYAAWKTADTTDRPDITGVDNMPTRSDLQSIGGVVSALANAVGRSVESLPLLTGGSLFWHLTYFRSDDAMFDLLATYCDRSGRARVPMVAGTYPSGGFVDDTGLVPSHAYSVLGFGFHSDGRKYVVLRNPWGSAIGGIPRAGYAVPVVGRWLGRLSLNNGDGGCFALAHGAFSAAFMALYGAE